ncbi:hypothetical protein [Paramaledivibacter caminithermalis]|jgi:hypothetical protein|uniref:Uncharacterized protein n=1 Tax=Paramaledivibacter caminithermalis (strain DSM 15212 / CIP 107654 / DViRD3) TaxID=1121301 RepID=A0A1M6LNB3_PARC5|nr:hypothetical protein [Paramaledivibacter caminithermalis]SHJ72650.1 hypothetical protein SAMN02745912_00860 [Paramaledivibacter caminithermalis DSM 15212]
MKVFMDFEEHIAMKEKRSKKMKSKQNYGYKNDLDTMMNKKRKKYKSKLKNNKRLQYDYEDDYYDIDYDIDSFK